ncbi:MAG TPA: hypothetical protein VMT46_03670 [Anaerolineaceae bacterium]|nr:hypothetical protein [Anaerolineaceae bacterium]
MNVTFLNGNPDRNQGGLDGYLFRLEQLFREQGHAVTAITLRDLDLRGCNGCFDCWVRTPGECIQPDEGWRVRQALIRSDFTLLAAPLLMGFPSALLKRTMDKLIPLIHPYFAVAHGEAHHLKRYERYPRLGLLVEREASSDAADLAITADIFSRAALNMQTSLEFASDTGRPLEDLARAMTAPLDPRACVAFAEGLGPTRGVQVAPPSRLTVFNGSPRGKKGNTPLLLGHFLRGFETHPGRSSQIYHLNRLHDGEVFQQAFAEAECVWLGFPLYVDAMPGQVKTFIESLEPFVGNPGNPPIGFLVQSGFPEAVHSRHVERYLEKLAARLGSPYLGTIVRGGVEGIQSQPEKASARLYQTMYLLGQTFGATGRLDPTLLRSLIPFERFRWFQQPVLHLLARLPMLHYYWDSQLKQNGVYEQRFARPYEEMGQGSIDNRDLRTENRNIFP